MKKIYTIGHSNRSQEEFVLLLKTYKIKKVVDVRRFPTSKIQYFNKENLQKILKREGIKYTYLGNQLGGYRKEGYRDYMETSMFKEGLKKLEETAEKSETAIMCTEKLPWKCHRKHISMMLQKKGWVVTHIIDRQKTWTPKKPENKNLNDETLTNFL